MTVTHVLFALALGVGAGLLAGLFGVGGGILFVPTLVLLGLGQLEAEATSLLAILPTVAAGVWRQQRYGNTKPTAAIAVGVSSLGGVAIGLLIATSISEGVLRRLFGVLLLAVAAQLAWQHRSRSSYASAE